MLALLKFVLTIVLLYWLLKQVIKAVLPVPNFGQKMQEEMVKKFAQQQWAKMQANADKRPPNTTNREPSNVNNESPNSKHTNKKKFNDDDYIDFEEIN
jgi:hypothetical protein